MVDETLVDRALSRARKVLEVGSEAADVLVHLQDGMTPFGVTAVGLRIINSVREHRATTPEEYFAKGWRVLDVGPLSDQALTAVRLDPEARVETVPKMHDDLPALLIHMGDHTYGWSIHGSVKDPKAEAGTCWIRDGADSQAALRRIGQSLWIQLGSTDGVLTVRNGKVRLVGDDRGEALPSKRADDLHGRVAKFIEKGLHRSVFIIGDPGTGKSSLMRYVAGLVGGIRLRVRLSKMEGVAPAALIRITQVLTPTVLAMDDLDRYVMGSEGGGYDDSGSRSEVNATPEAAAMLDPLESFSQLIPLVMASANFSNTITGALLRPGRFDELMVLDKLDDELYAKLLPDAPPKLIRELIREKVPIAFVEELRRRVEVLGYEAAAAEMKELVARSDRVLELNRKRLRRKPRANSLVGKSPLQRAALLDRRAASKDLKAKRLAERVASMHAAADRDRANAETERTKAAKKKTSKKKTSKKAKGARDEPEVKTP